MRVSSLSGGKTPMEFESKAVGAAVDRPDGGELAPFLPLTQLQFMRKAGSSGRGIEKAERRMGDFEFSVGEQKLTFRYGIDFVEGNNRFCWTPAGIDKLLAVGLWRREFDGRGNLKSKPVTVEAAMKLGSAPPLA
jgi:hypothetical protein